MILIRQINCISWLIRALIQVSDTAMHYKGDKVVEIMYDTPSFQLSHVILSKQPETPFNNGFFKVDAFQIIIN